MRLILSEREQLGNKIPKKNIRRKKRTAYAGSISPNRHRAVWSH